ncbi:MAG: hypothetical protein EXR08_09575 [Alphaproteobacteria bacterium]|nr:hypothetical protein [Alphaproteobacteria bacterium]
MKILRTLRVFTLVAVWNHYGEALAQDTDPAGKLERAKNQVTARPFTSDPARPLTTGGEVFRNEMVHTGALARAELRLSDQTSLVLGENAEVRLDEFVYDEAGSATLNLVTGALRFVSSVHGHPGKLTLRTPVATIGIRGTDFWVGPIDGVYGVLLLTGNVQVSNPAGTVTLDTPRTGTLISGPDVAPGDAVPWPNDRRIRALSKTDF